ncbi:MAG: gliding motility protein GldM [Salinivirgaceae bacterium]|nr:gliding motility protein GldM [Salinivirgaceae bacterium]
MGHGKETPRQKMIGLMYLFLTALMALNVSKDVLNSFILVGESLEKTIKNYESKNEKLYQEFEKQHTLNPDKVGEWMEEANKVRKSAEELFKMLEGHKMGLAVYAEGPEAPAVASGEFNIKLLDQKDNIDKGGEYFGELGKKHGVEIKKAINEYQELLLERIPKSEKELRHNIEVVLETHDHPDPEGGAPHSWVSATFEHIPLIADFVILSKLQTDVKNMETDVANYLFNQITAGDFKVNAMAATVIPNSSYILKGSEYAADVFLAAYDSTQAPSILVGNYKENEDGTFNMVGSYDSLIVEGGRGKYKVNTSSTGTKEWGGLIRITAPDGGIQMYPFKESYQVAIPSLVVSPTKMNVFYYGIENPVAISVPGIPANDIKPRIASGATINKVKDGYIVKPTKRTGNVSVQVYADINGTQKSMGAMEFRIKTVPSPIAKVMGQASGSISQAMLSNAPSVYAELEDFVFDLKFVITKFTLVAQDGIYTREYISKGSQFTNEQKGAIKAAKRGSRITIENIEAKGPDGIDKPLSPIVFKLK